MWTNATSIKDTKQVFCSTCGGRNAPCSVAQVILDSPLRLVLDVHINEQVMAQILFSVLCPTSVFNLYLITKLIISLFCLEKILYHSNSQIYKIKCFLIDFTKFDLDLILYIQVFFSDMIISAKILIQFVLN